MAVYVEQAIRAQNNSFRNQVRIAMVSTARDIAGESKNGLTDAKFGKRQALAYQVLNNQDGYLDRFAWLVAANTALSTFSPKAISSSTAVAPSVITVTAHGYSTGDSIEVAGHLVNTNANGAWNITVLTANTFSIPVLGNGAGTATGYVVKLLLDSDIQFTVNAVFDDIAGVRIDD